MPRPDVIKACREAGAIDVMRVAASVEKAAFEGELMEALASLRHYQPELFDQPIRPTYAIRQSTPQGKPKTLRDYRSAKR